MIVDVYEADGRLVEAGMIVAGDRWELRRRLAAYRRPGRVAHVIAGPRARRFDVYTCIGGRSLGPPGGRWLRGERRDRI